MSGIDIFSNAMVLFWILVQQVCLCYIKWAYEDLNGRARRARLTMAAQVPLFVFFAALAFDQLLGLDFAYGRLPAGALYFYGRLKWNFFCAVMLVLDALLVAYAWRMSRLYARAPETPFIPSSPALVFLCDAAIAALFASTFIWYHAGMTEIALRLRLGPEDVRMLQYFYIKVSNFFYALFEGTAAILLWGVYRRIRKEADGLEG